MDIFDGSCATPPLQCSGSGILRTQNGYLLGQGVLTYFKPLALILVRFGEILKQNKCQCVDFS